MYTAFMRVQGAPLPESYRTRLGQRVRREGVVLSKLALRLGISRATLYRAVWGLPVAFWVREKLTRWAMTGEVGMRP